MAEVVRMESINRGYHVYQGIWQSVDLGEELACRREAFNPSG